MTFYKYSLSSFNKQTKNKTKIIYICLIYWYSAKWTKQAQLFNIILQSTFKGNNMFILRSIECGESSKNDHSRLNLWLRFWSVQNSLFHFAPMIAYLIYKYGSSTHLGLLSISLLLSRLKCYYDALPHFT